VVISQTITSIETIKTRQTIDLYEPRTITFSGNIKFAHSRIFEKKDNFSELGNCNNIKLKL